MRPQFKARARPGFTLLELVVVILIISIISVVLSDRALRIAEGAEKTAMEYTANVINSALLFEFAARVIQNRRSEIPRLTEANPIKLLAQQPANYLGEFRDTPVNEEQAGNWYYDLSQRELVYLVKRGDNFQADRAGRKRVRFRVKLLYDEAEPGKGKIVVGAVLTPIESYKWF